MKKKVSAFEFAIMNAADPEYAKYFEPRTREEELQLREANLKEQAKRIRIKKH